MTRLDPTIIRQQIGNLLVSYPELADDEVLRANSIEGETDAFEFLTKVVRGIDDARALYDGVNLRLEELEARRDRFDERIKAYRSLAYKIMQAGNLTKAELPDATLSMRAGTIKVVGEPDPKDLPDSLVKIERKPDKTAIKRALENGETVPGCHLSNGEPTLSIRGR